MAKAGGVRPGAGRSKGSLSQRRVELLAGAVSEGVTPVECMLSIMRNDEEEEKSRAWAAEKAAPYIHPRPAPIARPIETELPDTSTVDGINKALACLVTATAQGRIAPSEAQSISALIEAQRKAIETGDLLERLEALEASMARKE